MSQVQRRQFLIAAVTLLTAPLGAEAQRAEKVYRIGILVAGTPPSRSTSSPILEAVSEDLRALGWRPGSNVIFEPRYAGGRGEEFRNLAVDLVHQNVDAIIAIGTSAALAAKEVTKTIPIVFFLVADPVESGLVISLARPGGNLTGESWMSRDLSAKRLQLLREVVPAVVRVAVLLDPTNPGQVAMYNKSEEVAQLFGITLKRIDLRKAADVDSALATVLQHRAQALEVFPLPLAGPSTVAFGPSGVVIEEIIGFALKKRLPTIMQLAPYVQAGGLMFYGPVLRDSYRRTAAYVDKILRGAKPAELPVEEPTRFELVINLKTAKALGVTIPPFLLLRADRVIE